LAAFSKELYLNNLLKADPGLGSPTPEIRSCEDFDVRSEAPIPLGHYFHNDTHCDDLEQENDPSPRLAVAPFLDFSTVSGTHKGSLIVHDSPLPLAPLVKPKEGLKLEIDASFSDQCVVFVESNDTFFQEHFLNEPYIIDSMRLHLT